MLFVGVGHVDLGNRSKVPRRDPGASKSCVSDDDFVSPPLAFLARLEQDHVWVAPDDALTGEEDAAFPRIKTWSQSSILVNALGFFPFFCIAFSLIYCLELLPNIWCFFGFGSR
nr:uncharacterized protein LOC109163082 [Ipomoea batatas]GMC47802.1 uncharacterized protein LOC109163082 [Ipomoea batatas]